MPFRWVAADSVYGVGDIERDLRHLGKGYVLGVDSTHVFRSWDKKRLVAGTAAEIANTLEPSDWKRLSAGEGTKGPRLHDWCYLNVACGRGLLLRRNIDDGELAYFTTWCPAGTAIETLVNVEVHRWSIALRLRRTSSGLITTK